MAHHQVGVVDDAAARLDLLQAVVDVVVVDREGGAEATDLGEEVAARKTRLFRSLYEGLLSGGTPGRYRRRTGGQIRRRRLKATPAIGP